MKLKKVFLTTTAIVMVAVIYAQTANQGDICQYIPDLTTEQKQKIDKLSTAHQKTMDDFRAQFWSESDPAKASDIKTQMNTEMDKHYQNISALLSPEQNIWFNRNCYANSRRGFGRSQGFGPGRGYGRGQGFGPGRGCGRGRGRGRGAFTF